MSFALILRKALLTGFISSLLLASVTAQVSFNAYANYKQITTDDFLQIQFTLENVKKILQFIPPRFAQFEVVQGPNQTTGWNVENGELRSYTSFNYVLKPLKKGKFVIASATAKTDAGTIRSGTIAVEVLASGNPTRMAWPTEEKRTYEEYLLKKGESVPEKIKNNLFVRLEVDKTTCFEGEPVLATYKLYTRLKSESRVTKRPSFSGFSVYDMVDPESENSVKEKFNGKEYNVYILRKAQLYPLQNGDMELEPAEVENTVTFVNAEYAEQGYSISGLLNALVDDQSPPGATIREKITLASKPVIIHVKPLPSEKKPASFNGAVGKFSISATLNKRDLHRNDVASLDLIVKGNGNLPMIASPSVKFPDSFETYEPVVKEEHNRFIAPLSGSKQFSIPFSPKQEGDFIIPAVELAFFDPDSGKYHFVKSDTIKIHVSSPLAVPANSYVEKVVEDVWGGNNWLKWAMVALTISVGLFGFYLLQKSKTDKIKQQQLEEMRKEDELWVKRQAEVRLLKEQLSNPFSESKFLLNTNDSLSFYRQLGLDMRTFLSRKYDIARSADMDSIKNHLRNNGTEVELVAAIESLMNDCELAIYTPVVMEQKMFDDLAKAEAIVLRLRS